MKTRNILNEIYKKKISPQTAHRLFRHLINTNTADTRKMLSLEMGAEWTALILYGIPLHILAQWRYEGWPNICTICDKSINAQEGGWKAFRKLKTLDHTYYNVLAHWDCYHSKKE